jgi:small subunit ribosomal protein S3
LGQKANPIGLRLGINRNWDSNWYEKKECGTKLLEDITIRNYIRNRLKKAGIAKILIERTLKHARITIYTSRPGLVIGRSGKEISQLEEELKKITYLVAETIAGQIEGRISFRRAMKSTITSAMRMGAEGVRIMCAGRLGGAEIARTEQYKEGRIPLHTLRADIDYATATARTIYGAIGIKVWICKGEILGGMFQ